MKLFVLSLAVAITVRAAEPVYDFSPIDRTVQGWMDQKCYPGAYLLVFKDDRVICEKSWGNYSRETAVHLMSATKWLEAATVMALVDEGKIDLDAPISRYLPQLTGLIGQNTVRHCLSHTSNLNGLKLPEPASPDTSMADFIPRLAKASTEEKPGSRFKYGGAGLGVALRIAEVVTGQSWEVIFAQRIAKPCQMKRTTTGGNLWFVDRIYDGYNFPGSCAQDYANFLEMLAHNGMFRGVRVLSEKAVREMQADQVRTAEVEPQKQFPFTARGSLHTGIYGFGEWRERLDDKGEAVLISSAAAWGFYPWLDKTRNVRGVFVAQVFQDKYRNPIEPMSASASLADLICKAVDAGDGAVKAPNIRVANPPKNQPQTPLQ